MTNVWVGTDWHLWNREDNASHPYRSISNLGRLSDHYAQDIQVGDIFIHLGDLCDPGVTDPKKLKAILASISGYKVLCKGNHDTQDDAYYLEMGFDEVCDVCTIHNIAFSHKPMKVPPDWINIHGHLHTEKLSTMGSNHINAFDTNFSDHPVLVDDLLERAPYQKPEEYASTNLAHVAEKFEKYTTLDNETYSHIIDLTDRVQLVPVDEAAGNAFDLIEVSEIQSPEKLSRWMKSNIHYSNFTRLKTQAEVIKTKSGSCHDQVTFAYPYLKKMGVNPRVLFFIAYKEGSTTGGMTHSLIFWESDNKVYWFENSWKGMEGIHEFDDLDELKEKITELYEKMPASKNHPELEFRKTSIRNFKPGATLSQLVETILGDAALSESWNTEYGDPDNKLPVYFSEPVVNEQFIIDRITEFAELIQSPVEELKVIITDSDKFYESYSDNPYIFGTYDEVGDYVILTRSDQVPPEINYSDLVIHECCHGVLYKANPDISEELAEGLCISWAFAHYEQLEQLGNRLNEPRYYAEYENTVKKIRTLRDKFGDIVYYYLANGINISRIMEETVISHQPDSALDEVLFQDVEDTKYFLADDDADNEIIDESKSELDSNFVPKDHISITSLKKVHITEAIINKYKKEYPVLRHVRCKDTKEYKCDGYMWFNDDDELVCHVGSCEYLDDHTKWIVSLEVLPKYKGHGISTQILDFAVKTMGCKYLSVNKNNKLAKHIYDKYGFKTYQDDKSMYYMTLESNGLPESVLVLDEASTYYRYTYDGQGIYDALRQNVTADEWKQMKTSDAFTWLPVPDVYAKDADHTSFFTDKGNRWFLKRTMPLMHKHLDKDKIKLDKITIKNSDDIVYSDKYQTVIPTNSLNSCTEMINESATFDDAKRIDYHEMDRSARRQTMEKYGLKTPGQSHEYTYDEKPESDAEKRMRERREKRVKSLKKARRVKKRRAFVRKVKSKLSSSAKATNESTYGINISVKSTKPSWITDSDIEQYKTKAENEIEKYQKSAKNVPSPKRMFKANTNIQRSNLVAHQLKSWVKIKIDGATPDTYYVHSEPTYTLLFVSSRAKKMTEVYLMDSFISDYHKKIGSYTSDIKLGNMIMNALHESYEDTFDYDHSELWGDQVHWFDQPDHYSEIQESAFDTGPRRFDEAVFKGQLDEYETWLIKEINKANYKRCIAEINRIENFRDETMQRWITNLNAVSGKGEFEHRVGSEYKKKLETAVKLGSTAERVKKHINWLKSTYITAIKSRKSKLEREGLTEAYNFRLVDDVRFVDTLTESADDDKLYPVYVMLMHSGTALANAIKTVTQSNFSHSSISFDSSMRNMYSFGRKEDLNPLVGGFKKEDIHSKFFKDRDVPYALYVVPCTKSEIAAMKKRLDYFVRNKSKFKYDFTGLFKNYFGIADNPEYKWFCSRFVADILNAGRPSSDPYVVEPSLMQPEDFAHTTYATYVCGGMLATYDQSYTDKRTKAILRIEMMNRSVKKQLEAKNECAIFDLDPLNPFIETTLEYQLTTMDESAIPDFLQYLKSFKVRFDPAGNIIITRREVTQLDQHFRQSVRMVKAYKKAGNIEGVKDELAKVHFMIEMINTYYLNPKVMQSNRVKADMKKEMMDLRSVMLNMFQQNLMWITAREPQFNFQSYYDGSKYGKETYVPKTILSALGKMIVTTLS